MRDPSKSSYQSKGRGPNLIEGLKFSSNNDKINLNDRYSSKFAELSSKQSWAGNPQARYLSYLQVTFPDYYHIDGIITKGRAGSKEWVTRYYVEYWDRYSDNWVKYPQIMNANRNDSSPVTNQANISTNKLRIYPVKWHKHPSLRIGFIGNKTGFSKCRYYRMKMKSGNTIDRHNYQRLYQKKCLKVPKETFDMVVNNLRKNKKKMCLNKNKIADLEKKQIELEMLKKQCCLVANELKQLKGSCCPREQLLDLANRYRKLVDMKRELVEKKDGQIEKNVGKNGNKEEHKST
jgi:hypothetical protein